MKSSLGAVPLFNRQTEKFESAELFQELDEKNLLDFEQLWKPALDQLAKDLSSSKERAKANVQDAHWDWRKKADLTAALLRYQTFAIECDGVTQGMMLIDLVQYSRITAGRELAYVEFLASAPWNRVGSEKRYKGVGRILLAVAISESSSSGFAGRVGLHSLPQAESWYRDDCGFTDLGYDDKKELQYFEATEEQAKAFVADKEKSK